MDWIVIESFASELDALIAKGKLEAAGLNCRTQLNQRGDTMLGAFGMKTGSTDLLVEKTAMKTARKLLDEEA